jgi:hypothetical protein
MILKFRTGETDWRWIEGFREINAFNVREVISNKEGGENYYAAVGTEERFNPVTIYHLNLLIPMKVNVGIIGVMEDPKGANGFLLLGCDQVFILSNEGKTIDRIY